MAQRLNKKVIVGLTTVGMAVTTAAGVVMIMNLPKRDPQQFVQQAEKYEADKDYKNAAIFFQRAYQRATTAGIDTHTADEYLTRAGDMALKAGDARTAMNAWRK